MKERCRREERVVSQRLFFHVRKSAGTAPRQLPYNVLQERDVFFLEYLDELRKQYVFDY